MQEATRILFVDDSKEDRGLVFRALYISHGGFHVTEVASKEDLETRLSDGDYDLILSDIGVFGFNGLEIIDYLQNQKPQTPIIIVTNTGS
jgi:CheY-like chemotaxis protein